MHCIFAVYMYTWSLEGNAFNIYVDTGTLVVIEPLTHSEFLFFFQCCM